MGLIAKLITLVTSLTTGLVLGSILFLTLGTISDIIGINGDFWKIILFESFIFTIFVILIVDRYFDEGFFKVLNGIKIAFLWLALFNVISVFLGYLNEFLGDNFLLKLTVYSILAFGCGAYIDMKRGTNNFSKGVKEAIKDMPKWIPKREEIKNKK